MPEFHPKWLFKKFPATMNANKVGAHGAKRANQQNDQLRIGELGGPDLPFRLFRQQKVGRTKKAQQQPNDQRVGVDHADHVERQKLGQEVGGHIHPSRQAIRPAPECQTTPSPRESTSRQLFEIDIS